VFLEGRGKTAIPEFDVMQETQKIQGKGKKMRVSVIFWGEVAKQRDQKQQSKHPTSREKTTRGGEKSRENVVVKGLLL